MFTILLSGCGQNQNINVIEETEKYTEETSEKLNDITNDKQSQETEEYIKTNLKVHFIDVGQADACLIESNNHFMMIDAGNNDDADLLLNYLNSKNVKTLDYMIGTHPHEDHIGSMDSIIDNFNIEKIYMPRIMNTTQTFEDVLNSIESKNLKITEPIAGNEFYFNGLTVKIIAPIKQYDSDINNNSIVLKIIDGDISFLFTGDIEDTAENDIIESGENISADVLKVAHHGSDSSSTENFIESVSPKYAVISVGKFNDYNHPSKSTISLLNNLNIKTYRTDEYGTVIIETDGKHINILTNDSNNNLEQNEINDNSINTKENEKSVNEYFNSDFKKEEMQEQSQTETQEKYYIGNKNSNKFHTQSCKALPSSKNQIKLNSREEAINKGYSPCKICNP